MSIEQGFPTPSEDISQTTSDTMPAQPTALSTDLEEGKWVQLSLPTLEPEQQYIDYGNGVRTPIPLRWPTPQEVQRVIDDPNTLKDLRRGMRPRTQMPGTHGRIFIINS